MTSRRLLNVLLSIVVLTVSASALTAQETGPRLMTAKDTQAFTNVGSPRISPDDQWVLYTRSLRDWDDEELGRTNTHMARAD